MTVILVVKLGRVVNFWTPCDTLCKYIYIYICIHVCVYVVYM